MVAQILITTSLDIIIYYLIGNFKPRKIDVLFCLGLFVFSFIYGYYRIPDLLADLLEIVAFYFFFRLTRSNSRTQIFSLIIVVELFDMTVAIITSIINLILYYFDINIYDYRTTYILELLLFIILLVFSKRLNKIIKGNSSTEFLLTVTYLYITLKLIYYFILQEKYPASILKALIIIFIVQSLFAISSYIVLFRIKQSIIIKKEQENQALHYQLIEQQKKALTKENNLLKEYTEYLDKNEDELRSFKHDYQNILNGLIITARKGNVDELVRKLEEYTATQFDQQALRKYKGINHIKVAELKSIALAKLTKLYDLKIPYSFDSNDITNISPRVDIFDLVRIIGIAFDNAIEESQSIMDANSQDSVKVDAMYHQESGEFEFQIRNLIQKDHTISDKIEQRNFTTKKDHMGIGLANVEKIVAKYPDEILINYDVDHGWFEFTLVVLAH